MFSYWHGLYVTAAAWNNSTDTISKELPYRRRVWNYEQRACTNGRESMLKVIREMPRNCTNSNLWALMHLHFLKCACETNRRKMKSYHVVCEKAYYVNVKFVIILAAGFWRYKWELHETKTIGNKQQDRIYSVQATYKVTLRDDRKFAFLTLLIFIPCNQVGSHFLLLFIVVNELWYASSISRVWFYTSLKNL
jgi:hypothetical protein